MIKEENIKISNQMLSIITELDEFKGTWTGLEQLSPERLKTLKKIATIESVGSSNRIAGNKLSNVQVEELLYNITDTSQTSLTELETKILNYFSTNDSGTNATLLTYTGANRNTLKKAIASLVDKNRLIQHSKGRGTWYSKA